MAFNLEKGGRFNLSKEAPNMTRVKACLGWDANGFDSGTSCDLDAAVFGLNGSNKLVNNDHFIFYNQPATPNKSVVHSGDNRSGDATGDDEVIAIDLSLLDSAVAELSFIVTIHDAATRKQNFGQIRNSYIRLLNADTGAELARYNLEDDFSTETAVQFGSLYKKDGQWLFKAVGAGFKKGLADFVQVYTN